MLLESPEAKLQLATSNPPQSISFLLSQIITYCQAFIYLGFTIKLVRDYQTTAKNTLSGFNPGIFNWLWRLLLLAFLIWSLKLISHISDSLSLLAIVGDILIIVMIYSVAMAQWRNPEIFKIEQLNPGPSEKSVILPEETEELVLEEANKNNSALNISTRKSILIMLKQYMYEQQAFKNAQLTLTNLSEALGVTSHHLSEVLNQQEGKNFYQFVNEYRVDDVCESLKKNQDSKVLELAIASGFSSKSTFNTVFKQYKGMTPTQYRNNISS